MAEKDDDILTQFQEFLTAKKEQENAEAAAQDDEVEIWNEKGQGARVRRSVAKPFLQSLGIDLDAADEGDAGDGDNNGGDAGKGKPKGPAKGAPKTSGPASNVARKYFVKTPAK